MSTHPEVVTLDPNDAEQMEQFLRRLMNERDLGLNAHSGLNFTWENVTDALRAMTVPPPEEPSLWSVAKVFNRLFVRGQSSDSEGRWFEVSPGQGMYAVAWPEVCALGTPEVLEPDSVKALRTEVTNLAAEGVVAEAERDEAQAAVRKMQDHHGECICNTAGPALEGPDEYCPWHGRPWDDMLEHLNRMVTEARETIERVRAERDNFAAMAALDGTMNGGALAAYEDAVERMDAALAPTVATLDITNMAFDDTFTEDEPAEPAPVEVTEPAEGSSVVDCEGDTWVRSAADGLWRWEGLAEAPQARTFESLNHVYGPLTLVETGGQS